MITRQDIEDEAAWVQRLINLTNPTGRLHSATPWAAAGEHEITAAGATIAQFRHEGDRDAALYFTNVHAGMIQMLRTFAESFEFIAKSSDEGARSVAGVCAENARAYADLFCRLGKPEGDDMP